MKLYIKLFLLPLFLNLNIKSQAQKINLIGSWTLTDYSQNKSKFILNEEGYVSMSVNGEYIDGKNFIVHGGKNDGQTGELKYSINYDKNPIEIDIIAIKDGKEKGRILGAIKSINDNEFLMTFSFNGERDFDFSEKNVKNIATLERKK